MTLSTTIAIVSIIVSAFTAYHIFWLQKNSSIDRRFIHRKKVQEILDKHLFKIKNGNRSKIVIINSFFKRKYPNQHSLKNPFLVYSAAELKGYFFDGVEFFSTIKEAHKLTVESNQVSEGKANIFVVGVIPYEYIEYIDVEGDEYYPYPHFYVRKWYATWTLKNKRLWETPFKSIRYYVLNENYRESQPYDLKYRRVRIEDEKSGFYGDQEVYRLV